MAGERGYDFSAVLVGAGLDFNPLDRESPNWRAEISAMQYSRVYQQTLSLLQDETFGLHPKKVVSPGAFRMMCYCILSCDSLGKAIKRTCEFYLTFFDAGAQIAANFTDEQAIVGYQGMHADVGIKRVEATDAYGLSVWHRFFCWLTGRTIDLPGKK